MYRKFSRTHYAKNIILFIGEDLPVSTFKTARLYQQCLGDFCYDEVPKDSILRYYFQDYAIAKSECSDSVEPDVACATTAILTGAKSNKGTISLNDKVKFNSHKYQPNKIHRLDSIASWAQFDGKRTGLVTSGRVTSPGVSPYYGHTPNYNWQSDYDMAKNKVFAHGADLASQLINSKTGSNLNVILGGGRRKFLPSHQSRGERLDRRNLINEWLRSKRDHGEHAYIETKEELPQVCRHTKYLLGLFDLDHLNGKNHPKLAEMTAAAIKLLDKPNDEGFLLLVHSSKVYPQDDFTEDERQVHQHIHLMDAIKTAIDMTDASETLIIGTTDHYFRNRKYLFNQLRNDVGEQKYTRKTDIPEIRTDWDFSTYGTRVTAILNELIGKPEYSEDYCDIRDTGDDAMVFAYGPYSHLFSGIMQQNYIAYIIGYAACIGDSLQMCDDYYI
ncbi:membrane-bound alkaline phosphatase-like isoform X2 [Atheta coriaria]|uniref:membrane-bound alkaline phosphatase-like isoform X2 n=1 Tax=Dalotia coriaria TaxID=877792 RepID=UPI0031F43D47